MKQRTIKINERTKLGIGLTLVFLAFIAIGKLISGIQLPIVNEELSLPEDSIFTTILIFAGVNAVILGLIFIKKIKERAVSVLLGTFIGLVLVVLFIGELSIPH